MQDHINMMKTTGHKELKPGDHVMFLEVPEDWAPRFCNGDTAFILQMCPAVKFRVRMDKNNSIFVVPGDHLERYDPGDEDLMVGDTIELQNLRSKAWAYLNGVVARISAAPDNSLTDWRHGRWRVEYKDPRSGEHAEEWFNSAMLRKTDKKFGAEPPAEEVCDFGAPSKPADPADTPLPELPISQDDDVDISRLGVSDGPAPPSIPLPQATMEWSQEEKETMIRHCKGVHTINWPDVAKALPGRTSWECTEYWFTHLKKEVGE